MSLPDSACSLDLVSLSSVTRLSACEYDQEVFNGNECNVPHQRLPRFLNARKTHILACVLFACAWRVSSIREWMVIAATSAWEGACSLGFERTLLFIAILCGLVKLAHLLFAPLVYLEKRSWAKAAVRRNIRNAPPPFPTGWFKVADVADLQYGQVRPLAVLGQELVLFRAEQSAGGAFAVFDAYCPHLGANLAIGGRVKGDCIECPFHAWQFSAKQNGQATCIPYATSSKIPAVAKIRSWPVRECDGMVLLWHDLDGRDPLWEPQGHPQFNSFRWHGCVEHFVSAHIQDLPENGADANHLPVLHSPALFSWMPFIEHVWSIKWAADKERPHVAVVKLDVYLTAFGIRMPGNFSVTVEQHGPGYNQFTFKHGLLFGARVYVIQSTTPVKPFLQKFQHTVYADKWVPRFVAKMVLQLEIFQVDRDIAIWSHKQFLSKPVLIKEDEAILRFRRWYAQFHPENRPQDLSLDW